MDFSTKGVPLPKFDQNPESFYTWTRQFKVYVGVYRLSQAIREDGPDPDLPLNDSVVIDDTTDLGKKERVAKERNTKECAMLQAAQISDANEMGKAEPSLDTLDEGMTDDWPEGLAHLLWKKSRISVNR